MMIRLLRSSQRQSALSVKAMGGRIIGGIAPPNTPIVSLLPTSTTYGLEDDPTNHTFQVRWKRRDGHSSFIETRKATKKQKRIYRKRQREIFHEKVGKHSAPGSKAGPRRESNEEYRQQLLNYGKEEEDVVENLDYNYNRALLDDIVGNTSTLTSTPTPEPRYYGHKHKNYYNKVATQMTRYKEAMLQLEQAAAAGDNADPTTSALMDMATLPSDGNIANVARAFRDRHGTRHNPIGAAKILEHLLKDLGLPVSSFGESTFSTILTCCSTPNEARRIFKLMLEHKHPISVYSWSILVNIHAKLGDFKGCDDVLKEMVIEGMPPSVPAYTSLLAACYKVCNAGHIPAPIRAEAGELAWEKWKEMRIIGLKPDAMTYGAMLRICAARGHAEKAINILDEMPVFEVKPTTLCFTSALKAVARSHQIAIRYEKGASEHYRRRQIVASHHGKMARDIVLKAETAEVVQDDGFISALMLCAGSAGDSATAKAILLASEVRKMDHLRNIGSDAHLRRLQGIDLTNEDSTRAIDAKLEQLLLEDNTDVPDDLGNQASGDLAITGEEGSTSLSVRSNQRPKDKIPSFGEREYGKDSRVLSALMLASAQALDPRGLGTMWEGRDNKGYLCETSLQRLKEKPEPTYMDNEIPGVSSTEVGLGSFTSDKEDEAEHTSRALRRKKFAGLDTDDSGTNMDDLDPYLYNMHKNDDPLLKRVNPDSVVEQLPLDDPAWDLGAKTKLVGKSTVKTVKNVSSGEPKEEWYFDMTERKWKSRMVEQVVEEEEQPDDGMDQLDDGRSVSREEFFRNIGLGDDDDEGDLFGGDTSFHYDATTGEVRESKDTRYQEKPVNPEKVNEMVAVKQVSEAEETEEEWFFDKEERKWKSRIVATEKKKDIVQPILTEYEAESMSNRDQTSMIAYANSGKNYKSGKTKKENDLDIPDFHEFMEMLQNEIDEDGAKLDFSEEEARDLYRMMSNDEDDIDKQAKKVQAELEEIAALSGQSFSGSDTPDAEYTERDSGGTTSTHQARSRPVFGQDTVLSEGQKQMLESMKAMGLNVDEEDFNNSGEFEDWSKIEGFDEEVEEEVEDWSKIEGFDEEVEDGFEEVFEEVTSLPKESQSLSQSDSSVELQNEKIMESNDDENEFNNLQPAANSFLSETEYRIAELTAVLPGMPENRVKKVADTFDKNLGYPSLLELTPILRENIPERVTGAWLQRKNVQNAAFVLEKARQDGLVDLHMMNGMLQVETSSGSIDRALACHDARFRMHGFEPTQYSDRLVLQMLIKNNRLSRALKFKEKVEEGGRKLDPHSYGALVEYYAKKRQIGSSLMMLKECVSVHGAPPNEYSLNPLRRLCRHQHLTELVGLEEIVGPDPRAWLQEGEAKLKREYSYRGRRDVQRVNNMSMRV